MSIILTKIIGLLYVVPFYSIVGEKGGALYGYAYNIYNLFLIISIAGVPLAISKLTSEYNTLDLKETKVRMYRLTSKYIMLFSLFTFLILFMFAPSIATLILGDLKGGNTIEDVTFVIRIVSFALLIIPTLSISRGYLQGHNYQAQPSYSQIIEQLVRIGVILAGSFFALKIFHLSMTTAVGIAVFGATAGGIAAYFYLLKAMKKDKHILKEVSKPDQIYISDKEILNKIITYSIPFIIIYIANTIYYSIDMVLVLRTLTKLGYSAADTEAISSVFTTWGVKIQMILTAISSGLVVSLIPHIVSSYVKNDMKDVNHKFNQSLKTIFLIIVPLAVFISLMAQPVWTVLYGKTTYGYIILSFMILTTILDSLNMVLNSLLQSLNKYKIIYISTIAGVIINAALDIPMMYLFHNLGIYAFYGAIAATFIGFSVSVLISLFALKKHLKLNFRESFSILPRVLVSLGFMVVVTKLLILIVPITSASRMTQLLNLMFYGLINMGIFVFINLKHFKPLLENNFIVKKIFRLFNNKKTDSNWICFVF